MPGSNGKAMIRAFSVFLLMTLVVFSLSLSACAAVSHNSDFIIRVSGTDGLPFNGGYSATSPDGNTILQSVEGTVPFEYSLRGSTISCEFKKQSEDGTLRVEILKNGNVLDKSETSAAYGILSAAGS